MLKKINPYRNTRERVMPHSHWDWAFGEKPVADIRQWKNTFKWIEGLFASPDGEKIGAIVKIEDAAFSVCVNGILWEQQFDKIWSFRFGPDNRPSAIVCDSGLWTVAADGQPWENRFEFVWDIHFSEEGRHIVAAAQNSGKYFAVSDRDPLEKQFPVHEQFNREQGRHS